MREKLLLYHTRRPTSPSPVHSENLDIQGYAKAAQNVPLLLSQVTAFGREEAILTKKKNSAHSLPHAQS